MSTELAEHSTLAGFISTFVKKRRRRQKGVSDKYDNMFYDDLFKTPFIRQEMSRQNCNTKLDVKLIKMKKRFERLDHYLKEDKIILLEMNESTPDNELLQALQTVIVNQLETVIQSVSHREDQLILEHEGVRPQCSSRIASYLLAAMKMWRLNGVDMVEKLQYGVKDMLRDNEQYISVGKQLFQLALERNHSKEERLLIVRTLLNKNFQDYFKLEHLASLSTMLQAYRDATRDNDPLVYCQLDSKFNDFDALVKEIKKKLDNKANNTESTDKTPLKSSFNDWLTGEDYDLPESVEDYFVRQLRKNFNMMAYGKRRLAYAKTLDNTFRFGSMKAPSRKDYKRTKDLETGKLTISGNWSANAALKAVMFWCVITDNTTLLDYFWQKSESPVMTGLVIVSIYRSLSRMSDCDRDTQLEFQAEAEKYEQRAYDVFKTAHDINWRKAEVTLTQKHDEYHHFSVMEMAGTSQSQKFLSHPGVWNRINEIWTRKQPSEWISGRGTYIFDWSMQLIFVCLFASMLVNNICHAPSEVEYVLIFWIVCLLVEEFRQMLEAGTLNFWLFNDHD